LSDVARNDFEGQATVHAIQLKEEFQRLKAAIAARFSADQEVAGHEASNPKG
jgi:hypothetical protein